MLSKSLLLIVAVSGLYAQDRFALGSINVPPIDGGAFVEVDTTGPAPDIGSLQNAANWRVFASPADSSVIPILKFNVEWHASTLKIRINYEASQIGARDPRSLAWAVIFQGIEPNLATNRDRPKPGSHFTPAKGKDDADIYLFGSYLAGVSTKPIYVIDAKFNWMWEITKRPPAGETKRIPTGWLWGLKSSISSNTDTKAPVNRSKVDPDAVDGSLSIERIWTPWRHGISGIGMDFRPIAGEFSRKYPASDLLTKGYFTLLLTPKRVATDTWVALYPSVGYEFGHNLNTPSVLFKQPVDLSGWNAIARAVFITKGELYALTAKPKEGDVYRFTIDAAYQPRVPFTTEPYVTSEFVAGQRTSVARLRKNTRHEVEAGVNYNFSTLFGLRLQYKYGALPPLFEFVDHQVTVGLTLKTVRKP
jgi:hypothetical protein